MEFAEACSVLGVDEESAGPALRSLVDDHLVVGHPDGSRFFACDPEIAASHLVGDLVEEIQWRKARVSRLRSRLAVFGALHKERAEFGSGGRGVERLRSYAAVRAELARLSEQSRHEVVCARPGVPTPEELEGDAVGVGELLSRGVAVRAVYPHTVLAHQHLQRHLEALAGLGAAIRTTGQIRDQIFFFDQRCAVLPAERTGDGGGGSLVREAPLVHHLYRSWEAVWETATPFTSPESGLGYGGARRELHRSIVLLLEAGLKDEAVAHRLGMSVRACRRHVAEIMEELGACSRFQAGSYARRSGWFGGV
jgi:hypothetical protein